jgi:SAM-dependent methyltransferase
VPKLATRVKIMLRPRGREAFIDTLPRGARVLDVGCGTNSPYYFKTQRPDLYYVGVDVGDYNHSVDPGTYADEYHICTPDAFAPTIAALGQRFDAVVSSHNIEHCNDPGATLAAMADVLVPGGRLFMAWPSEASLKFPSRAGCLNFHDDPTHQTMPLFDDIVGRVTAKGTKPEYLERTYKPLIPYTLGMVLEPVSALQKKKIVMLQATWAFYGFESVAWFAKAA